jgi:o-succinylbenzoate synthase
MLRATFKKHTLQFKFEAGTSRGILKEKDTWYLSVWDDLDPNRIGIGECGPLKGLSIDDRPDFERKLEEVCKKIGQPPYDELKNEFPAIQFGLETALLDLQQGGIRQIFPNDFTEKESPIPINGLIWMGSKEFMLQQIEEKLQAGFSCLKLKIGTLDFDAEKSLLASIRSRFSSAAITLRLDANGAFLPGKALEKLKYLSEFDIHSIEQPIQARQIDHMATLCDQSPIPIALDEELIGIQGQEEKRNLLEILGPQYIILKPSLLGGFQMTDEWIDCADPLKIGWWITSALESNIGLNAICQYTYEKHRPPHFPQGLGTGGLYHNNIQSPLHVTSGQILYEKGGQWGNLP